MNQNIRELKKMLNKEPEKILVTGAGGFIGHHLVRFLRGKGYWVRGADIKYPEFSARDEADEFMPLDLRKPENCMKATEGMDKVYTLAANTGGAGFIAEAKADIMRDNALIDINMAEAAKQNRIKKLFYSSSACVYPTFKQEDADIIGLKEDDAYPADPDNEYGWEKLFSERVYKSYCDNYGLEIRIARYHNIFGPEAIYDGGRERAPAALCRKIAEAKDGGEIKIWGDGNQTRSFLYITDCLEGTYRLMESDYRKPVNIGSDRKVTINEMADMIALIADKKIGKIHLLDKPQGVRGRNSDNTLCKEVLSWEPRIPLEHGLEDTYKWVEWEVKKNALV